MGGVYRETICNGSDNLPDFTVSRYRTRREKGFWASFVPDNSSAVKVIGAGKDFFGQLFTDTADTGKVLLNKGKEMIDATGETIKSVTDGE